MFSNLRAEMIRHSVAATDLARAIHKTDKSVHNKLKGQGDFTLTEVYAIRDTFFPDMSIEYLFSKDTSPQINRLERRYKPC